MNQKLYVDIHVLQTVPPSCVNRDDTGSPKTAVYGGVTRARVSSQAWKRAVREVFRERLSADKIGMRSLYLQSQLSQALAERNIDNPEKVATELMKAAGIEAKPSRADKEKLVTDALFFFSQAQIDALADYAATNPGKYSDKKAAQAALNTQPAIDIALFGRMAASAPELNTDASSQVAHAISTHRVSNEYDYFTALDDLRPEDTQGAGHLGTVEFNSSTLYRYATVAAHELQQQLGGNVVDAIAEFIYAFVFSMPTGKQNTFANRTVPDGVYVTIRNDQPINLGNAFEKPIPASSNGYVEASKAALIRKAEETYRDFAGEPLAGFIVGAGLDRLGEPKTFNELLDAVKAELNRLFAEG